MENPVTIDMGMQDMSTEVAHELRREEQARKDTGIAFENHGVNDTPNTSAEAKGLIPLNRKERRRIEKQRRSKVFQKAEAKRLERVRKQMQEQIDTQKAMEALNDVTFADPRNISRISHVFKPLTDAIDGIVTTGEVNAMPDGTALMWVADDGCFYPASRILDSVVEHYEKLSKAYDWKDHSDGLRRLSKRLELQMPVFQEDVDEARKTIEWMKFCTMTITPNQFTAVSQDIQIRHELEDQGMIPADADGTAK